MIQILFRVFRKVILTLRRRKILIYAGSYALALWTISSILFSFYEKIPLFEAFYWVITTTTTVGYGDITPSSFEGKLIALFTMLSGIGVLGIFLGVTAEILIESGIKSKRRVEMKDHVVILGWNRVAEIAVKELLSESMEVAVVADVEELPVEHRNLEFLRGEPSEEENLIRVTVEKAKSVLIATSDDTETLISAIAVKKLSEDAQITCVVSDHRTKKALEGIGVDQVLSIDEIAGLVLCRSVFSPRVSVFLNELMSTKGMEIYEQGISGTAGKTAGEVMDVLKKEKNATLIGVVREGKVILNPPEDLVLEEGDEVIYISESKID